MRAPLLAGLTVGLLLAATGCGDDEDQGFSEDEQKVVDALTATMEGSKPADYEKEQWRCTAEGIVEEVGVTELKKSGLVTENLESRLNQVKVNRSIATAIGDAYVECYDLDGYLAYAIEQEPRVPEAAWDAYGDCFDKNRDKLRASVIEANTLGAGRKAQKAWTAALTTCNEGLAAQAQ